MITLSSRLRDRLVKTPGRLIRRLAIAISKLLNRPFARERRAVRSGRLEFRRTVTTATRSNARLRRNIHRLEKGLVMRPRHRVFAEDYIRETVAAYRVALDGSQRDVTEAQWAHDVLRLYFDTVDATPAIDEARRAFLRLDSPASRLSPAVPYPRNDGMRADIHYDQFLALCRQRRSIRWFLPDRVPDELLAKAIMAAAEAPSACNRQPFFYRYFSGSSDAARVAGLAMGTSGYAHQVPALLAVIGDLGAIEHERDRHLIYIDSALATMQLMLALETLGLASCPINWPDVELLERRMTKALELPAHLRVVMLLAIGYPDPAGGVAYSAKKPVDLLLCRDNHYLR
jgi:nitroreductase